MPPSKSMLGEEEDDVVVVGHTSGGGDGTGETRLLDEWRFVTKLLDWNAVLNECGLSTLGWVPAQTHMIEKRILCVSIH